MFANRKIIILLLVVILLFTVSNIYIIKKRQFNGEFVLRAAIYKMTSNGLQTLYFTVDDDMELNVLYGEKRLTKKISSPLFLDNIEQSANKQLTFSEFSCILDFANRIDKNGQFVGTNGTDTYEIELYYRGKAYKTLYGNVTQGSMMYDYYVENYGETWPKSNEMMIQILTLLIESSPIKMEF